MGSANVYVSGVTFGGSFSGSYQHDGSVKLAAKSTQTTTEKENFTLGFLISKKTGKETGIVYQIFNDGQKIRIR
jgi:hypothetical protein